MRKRKGRRDDDDDDDDDDENARVLSDDSLSPSSLWEAIVKWDDVSFKHILPRLDLNDVKFLYGVNKETRKLIKRSSRKKELKKKFQVNEMSSISTLEWAWENRSLSWRKDEEYFCWQVARTNKLELLEWAREEKKCKKWDRCTINEAAYNGNLEMVKYCVANKCPIDTGACAEAARNGHLEVLKYLREEAKAPWPSWITANWAAVERHLHILEYLVERKYYQYISEKACEYAASLGHVHCLKYLHETAKAPWDYMCVQRAHENGYRECLQYLLDNNCPLPCGWRYEDGMLYDAYSESESEY